MTIYVCGDSTAASYGPERAPLTGWGQVLEKFVPGVAVKDIACGGRSSKSFLSEGRLQAVEGEMSPGDLVLIQFTHNDTSPLPWRHTEPWTSFQNTLSIFIDTARLHGAQPVLMTPICRRYWKDGALQDSKHGDYPASIRTLAMRLNVPLIDLYEKTTTLIRELGDEGSRKLYMNLEPGVYPAYPDGQRDDTHTQLLGAETYARMTADALRALGLIH